MTSERREATVLRPTKHSHPDRTVLNVALIALEVLKRKRLEDYDTLRATAKKRVSGGDVLFLPAVNFLYLMGLVEYRPKTDSFEYVGPNEAV
ncbi:ABC-three component system middle component 8 [Corynebacterium pseudodiphtheriticum]|uniref:ABC-three component system middle component 8 n=1 Tax=Corynebacterium pseudodiphtheriticum TaxID=37637 RepID=UPI0032B214C7